MIRARGSYFDTSMCAKVNRKLKMEFVAALAYREESKEEVLDGWMSNYVATTLDAVDQASNGEHGDLIREWFYSSGEKAELSD